MAMSTLLAFTTLALNLASAAQPSVQSSELPRRGALGLGLSPVPADVRDLLKIPAGEGFVAQKPVPGLTADMATIKEGDILLKINGKPVASQTIGTFIRETPSGSKLEFQVVRNGKPMTLSAALVEKPRDPGNTNYEVIYSHVVSNGQRMRTIITKPRKPGKYPGFFFIQGYSPVSYDFTLETSVGDVATLDGPILYDFANSGFITLRVEKPGVGDSEGGPFNDLDYITELDIYRQALNQLKAQSGLDQDNVFIFGHSMGGAFGPMVASEIPVKGLVVYGVAARTWHEYLVDSIRHQNGLAGMSAESIDEDVRTSSRIISLAFHENKTAEEIKKSHPDLAQAVDGMFPGGRFNNKTLKFWGQLGQINFPKYWAKTDAHVLAVKGASDFVVFESCHKLIADTVNAKTPGKGKWMVLPNSDHVFHAFATEPESQRQFTRGKFNPDFSKVMMTWIREVMAK